MSLEGRSDPRLREVERFGLNARVPTGWECRIGKAFESKRGEKTYAVLHAATVPLIGARADYGGGVVERLGPTDVFISLIEFGPEEAGSALFKEVDRLPVLEQSMFHRNQLQRRIAGQAGVQHFFTLNGRPFCLYVVLGSIVRSVELVERANELVQGLGVETS
jgi:hypothetical protein